MGYLVSAFAPEVFPTLPEIKGLSLFVAHSGLRYKNRDDLLLVLFDEVVSTAGVYTRSSMPSAPVDFCRKALSLKKGAKALVVNAGNANAFTGKTGQITVETLADILSKRYNCDKHEIYQASTGVIGQKLSGEVLAKVAIEKTRVATWEEVAKSFMTTDTFPKGAGEEVVLPDGTVIRFSGVSKGSGMIAPNMGTMLAYIFTDAPITQERLSQLLPKIADESFNSITVDGDTSTSDSLQVFATGKAREVHLNRDEENIFVEALSRICKNLALQIVKDGEGISKFVTITVNEASTEDSARKIGLSIANSPLVKTAIAGEDANWGRIIMAIGKSGELADRDKTSVSMGGVLIASKGEAVEGYDEAPVAKHMKGEYIDIIVGVGVGDASATVYTTDLTHGYIDINADYRS